MSRGSTAQALSRPPPEGAGAEPHSPVTPESLLLAVAELEQVLGRARASKTPDGWAEAQRAAQHVQDAVAAMAEGELVPDSSTFRQVDAALRAARAACAMPEAQATPAEAPASRGSVWVVCDDAELTADLARAI